MRDLEINGSVITVLREEDIQEFKDNPEKFETISKGTKTYILKRIAGG